ncbi:MAG: YitT family protein [Clostridium baratii]|uniref:YitT family protein n=1 Tax=Clostridium baratii TaxID=1561 RepID=UPI00242FFE4A|nr:YitT family protein [Clostridium baratii]MBS6007469.1 YitT family protein [Clostridium baratii]
MRDMLKIVLGNIFITLAYAFITVPNEIINGGVTSFSLILEAVFSIDIRVIVNIVTIILLLICLIFLGKEYFYKSIISSICYVIFFNFFYSLSINININVYIGAVIAAIMVGIGYYFCIIAKSTTVSFDIVAIILNKNNKKFDIDISMRYINIVIILLGLLNYGVESIILGIIFTIIQSYVLKYLLNREKNVNSEVVEILE